MRGTGGNAQDRRRTRRARERRTTAIREPRAFALDAVRVEEIQELVAAATELSEEMGGKPNPGTKPDKRLKENKAKAEGSPEDLALEALDAYGETLGARDIATMYLRIKPDMADFADEVEEIVEDALRRARGRALAAAAGEVAWGPEDGFVDLLCDVNEILAGADGAYYYDEGLAEACDSCYRPHPYAIDVGVNLDKVLVCDGDGDSYFVAPISIGADGEPVVSDRSEWRPIEQGWVEIDAAEDEGEMSASARFRFALRDLVLTADGATDPPLPDEHQPGESLPPRGASPKGPEPTASTAKDGEIPWTATFVPEGVLTEDGRAFAPGSLLIPPAEGSRELPLTLMAMIETSAEGGHDGARVAGRIDQLWRDGSFVKASGVFSQEEYGQQIARMVESQELRGLSVDIAPLEWERTPRSDWFDEAGNWIAAQNDDGDWVPAGASERTVDEAIGMLFGEDSILVITKGVIGMATVCPFPAFAQANIALAASGAVWRYTADAGFDSVDGREVVAAEQPQADEALTASAAGLAPVEPPAEWFADPLFDELTPMTITDDGRIYGHAWEWETCHLSFDGCVVAPHSQTEYAYFQLGEVECDAGERLAVGKITLDAAHAGQRLSRADAIRHYDHTGTVAAHVCFGEDEFGGWFSGAVSPDLSAEKLRLLRGATVSGDWRAVNGNLELVALLAVNVPGFPVPRPRYFAAGDEEHGAEVVTLTAAGIVRDPDETVVVRLSADSAAEIRRLALGDDAGSLEDERAAEIRALAADLEA